LIGSSRQQFVRLFTHHGRSEGNDFYKPDGVQLINRGIKAPLAKAPINTTSVCKTLITLFNRMITWWYLSKISSSILR
jgi:hypothetical protein